MNRVVGIWIVVIAAAIGRPVPLAAGDDESSLPEAVDLRPQFDEFDLEVEAQGARNTCSLFAISAAAEFEYRRSGHDPGGRFSQEYLVWAADEATGARGDQAMFYEALAGLNEFGMCTAESAPYGGVADDVRRPAEAAVNAARDLRDRWRVHWIKLWDVQQPLTDAQSQAIRSALAAGHPVACGLRWPHRARGHRILDVPSARDVYDGHSIVLTGYREDERIPGGGVFLFRNSNGPRWGDGGYGEMSFAYVGAYANDAVWLECGPAGSERPLLRIEAESARVLASERCRANPQEMSDFGGPMWSGNTQLFCGAWRDGSVTIEFETPMAGEYRVRLRATAAPDFGRVRVTLDGSAIDREFDLYSGRVCPAGSLELGEHQLDAGAHVLRLESVGKSDASEGFAFGIDAIDLLPPVTTAQ